MKRLLVFGLLATASLAVAQNAPTVLRLDLATAVSRALEVSPRVLGLAARERASAALGAMARSERWPQVDVSAGYSRRSEVPELSITLPGTSGPQTIDVFPSLEDNSRLRAGVQWPVFTGGRVGAQVAAASLATKAAESDTRAARSDLVLEVKRAYWGLVTAAESRRVLDEAILALDSHLKDARNREAAGMAARNEVLAVQVERDRSELESIRAAASVELAAARLRRLLDLPEETVIEPVEPIEPPIVEPPDQEALAAEALRSRAERTATVTRAEGAKARIDVERGTRLPQVALQASYLYANPNREIVPAEAEWKDTWDAGISVSFNLFDGGRRSAAVARARAEADAARELVREVDRALRLEVTERCLELRTAGARLRVAERGEESARENRRVAAERYREGVAASSDLLDAEIALERASLARTEALAALRLAAAGLDHAVGR